MSIVILIGARRLLIGFASLAAAPACWAYPFQIHVVGSPDRIIENRQLAHACQEGRFDKCGIAATGYIVDEADWDRALALYRRGCEGGIAGDCAAEARIYEMHALPSFDRAAAAEYLERAKRLYIDECNRSNASACASLATMLEDGEIAALDLGDARVLRAKARRIFETTCNAGGAAACRDLANFCGWKHDDDKCVLSATRRACELGDAESCCLLGHWHGNEDRGATRDPELAVRYLELACTGGDGKCCPPAAAKHREGTGVARDLPRAATLYGKGCELGDGYSCFELARMYESGKGARSDMGRARKLREKACVAGYKEACER